MVRKVKLLRSLCLHLVILNIKASENDESEMAIMLFTFTA